MNYHKYLLEGLIGWENHLPNILLVSMWSWLMIENLSVFKRFCKVKKNNNDRIMQDKIKQLHDNHIYDLINLSNRKRAIENMWIFKVKEEGR